MSLIMEDFKPSVNTLEEVKKLQELVRKLEIQNMHLRNNQNISRKRSVSPVKDSKSRFSQRKYVDEKLNLDCNITSENNPYSRDEYFDSLEIIGVSDIELSDDESWLYKSPKSSSENENNESPYKWLRKDVDDPENKQLQLAKKALLTKLNELEVLSPPSKTISHIESQTAASLCKTQVLYKTPLSVQSNDASHINTRTFTRSKKKEALEFLEKLDQLNRDGNGEKCCLPDQINRRSSNLSSSDSVSSCHALEDANDVQEVARMQEESLRMSSPRSTPKCGSLNSSSEKKTSTSRGSVSDQDLSENSVFSAHSMDDTAYDFSADYSYQMDPHHSDHSSTSESPYGSNASLHIVEKGKLSGYRRSLPNLNRDPVSRQSANKVTTKTNVQVKSQIKGQTVGRKSVFSTQSAQKRQGASPSRLRLHQKSPSRYAESVHSHKPATTVPQSANASESRYRATTAFPRPSRASSASRTPARSGIPMPSMLPKKRAEDSWSEGCF